MSRNAKIIALVAVFLLAAGASAYGIVTGDAELKREIPRMVAVAISFAGIIVKLLVGEGGGKRSLAFYEEQYKKELEHAFKYDRKSKKKLLEATRFYNEGKYKKSLKLLESISGKCEYSEDSCAVGLFKGLNYTDMGQVEKAHAVYEELIDRVQANETVYINMGHLLQTVYHEEDKAVECYKKALRINPRNAIIYNNLASLLFDEGDWDEAIANAKKALELDSKTYQAATLLAIIYSCMGNEEESKKYFAVAVAGGENTVNLRNAIEHYKAG